MEGASLGWSVLAVGLGDGWLLEVRDSTGPIDFLLARGHGADLFAPWADEALASIGARRNGAWAFATTSFGFRADLDRA